MRIIQMVAAVMAVTATGVSAQTSCTALDVGQYPLGHVLSQQQRQQVIAQAPQGTVHCSRDKQSCYASGRDGEVYSWRADGTIVRKKIELSDPTRLPGWSGKINQQLATSLGTRFCTRFTAEPGELDDAVGLRSATMKTERGRSFITTIFGEGTADAPIMIEMSLTE